MIGRRRRNLRGRRKQGAQETRHCRSGEAVTESLLQEAPT
jgi:hypothetical protein